MSDITGVSGNSQLDGQSRQQLLLEEFIQCYLQYRWLDETRSKLIDRFFIICLSLVAARLQFADILEKRPLWLLVLHVVLIISALLISFSIVRYRRQQRGHVRFIRSIRSEIFNYYRNFEEYKQYILGKRLYLTRGIETAVVTFSFLASFAPVIDRGVLLKVFPEDCYFLFAMMILSIILINIAWVIIPFYKYTFKKKLNWGKD